MAYTGEQKKAYQRAWLKNRRDKAIEEMGGKCVKCGSNEKLEFDHRDRAAKSYQIGSLWSRSWNLIWQELEKCQLLCAICHLEKTSEENRTEVCRNGHNKSEVGRDTDGSCSECRRQKDRRYRLEGRKK